MTRTELASASELLASAAERAETEHAERLEELADQLSTLAERERGPDHGRLARIESALDEVLESAGSEATESIESALEEIRAYRETLEGV